jgi:hypothetical protein
MYCPRTSASWTREQLNASCTAIDLDASWLPPANSPWVGSVLECAWSSNGRDYFPVDRAITLVSPVPVFHQGPVAIHRPPYLQASSIGASSGDSSEPIVVEDGSMVGPHFLQVVVQGAALVSVHPTWSPARDARLWLGVPCTDLGLPTANRQACLASAAGPAGVVLPVVGEDMEADGAVVLTFNATVDLDPWCNMSAVPACDVPVFLAPVQGQVVTVGAFQPPPDTAAPGSKALPPSIFRFMNDVLAFPRLPDPLRLPRPAEDEYTPPDQVWSVFMLCLKCVSTTPTVRV